MLRPAPGPGPSAVGVCAGRTGTAVGGVLRLAPVVVALGAMTLVLLAAGELARDTPAGIPDAGAAVAWAAAAGRLLMLVCAVLTVGAALVLTLLDPGDPRGERTRRAVAGWASAWAVCSACLAVLTVWHVTAVPPGRMPPGTLPSAAWALAPARALLVVSLLAAGVAAVAALGSRAGRVRGDRAALGLALVALAPPLYTGHAAGSPAHELATGGLLVHVVAASLWVGGLAALVLWVRPGALPTAAARFSTLALGCYVVLVASGVATAVAHLGTAPSAWWSGYGATVAGKTLAVVVLGYLGYRHRTWSLPHLAAGRRGPLIRLATVELLVMGVAMGLATGLSRTPGARPAATAHASEPASPTVTALGLVQDWQPEPVLSTVVLVGLTVLGHRWGLLRPGRGGALLATAAVLAVLVLGLPDDAAATALLGVSVARHLVLALAVPALLIAALRHTPVADRPAAGPGRPQVTTTTAFASLVASTVLVLRVPTTWSAGPAPGHLLLPAASLLCGAVVVGLLVTSTPAPVDAPDDARTTLVPTTPSRSALGAAAAFLSGVALVVVAGGPPLAAAGPTDVRTAAVLLAGAAVLLLAGAARARGGRDGGPSEHQQGPRARDFALS